MKKLFLFFGFFLLFLNFGSIVSRAQIRPIPFAVKQAFSQRFPGVHSITWQDKLIYVDGLFQEQGKNCRARFSSNGDWQFTEKVLPLEELPAAVQDGLNKSKYADWQVKEVDQVDLPGKEEQFKILVEKNELQEKNLFFNPSGRLLKDNITL
ncbi:MAG: PepSY-like domain-containing protein [Chitinophagaceae bacterium]